MVLYLDHGPLLATSILVFYQQVHLLQIDYVSFLARVTEKGGMRTWRLGNGSVKLFSFTVEDETCDLKITAFSEDADK